MTRLPTRLLDWISIHQLDPRGADKNVTYTKALVTNGSRLTGVCCNHYFAKDIAEVRIKSAANKNDFYERLANESSLRTFYSSVHDSTAALKFGAIMVENLRWMHEKLRGEQSIIGNREKITAGNKN
jgi:hypothetical protein